MYSQIKTSLKIVKNMGVKYTLFRSLYELKRKTGLLKKQFSIHPVQKKHISLNNWRKEKINFFFASKEALSFSKDKSAVLKEEAEKILNGEIPFFSSGYFNLGNSYDWITNPENGYKYDIKKHWSEIPDYSQASGDIKYVWEKSRFSFLYTIIRYDYHFEKDCSGFVFNEIINWIENNPLNMGPNYRCSQEISLRILNWTFALFYYKNSANLTEEIFEKILSSIYNQVIHVRDNINFSLIAVRNNHAITESLCLYLAGLLYPFFDIAGEIKQKGKKLFEQEIRFQVYNDGSYLQYSMNYHRVVVQLLTWALFLAEKNGEKFSDIVYQKAYLSLKYLYTCQDEISGELPNYGANDGALFFRLNNTDYRNYSSQLNALHYFYFNSNLYDSISDTEDIAWYNPNPKREIQNYPQLKTKEILSSFVDGGYYVINDKDTLTFIRCGSYKMRPSQADNLHIDIWYKGKNYIRDAGSYKYNTIDKYKTFFFGTASHNTVMLDNHDQMLKGPRFTWLNWTEAANVNLSEEKEYYVFTGEIKAFKHLNKNIVHSRKIFKKKNEPLWLIEDNIFNRQNSIMKQIWNISPDSGLSIIARDESGKNIKPEIKSAWYSSKYGLKEDSKQIIFSSNGNYIMTEIRIKE